MNSTPSRTSSSPPRLTSTGSSTLADVLERVLDKGIVIAGDISVSVGSTELLSIRIRLLIASVDKAKEMGINWWESDPFLSSQTRQLQDTNQKLLERVEALETELRSLKAPQRDPQLQPAPED
ncbi:gas vesicle protein [Desertifilum sp. FACHB-1129]|uniref:gas vesicle protein n=1 Tax=unclassified Desertifilum TaxID=2621682 RepID=UPI0009F2F029|nr:gas vesicle protein [Desertifilum tharense]MBD2311871.1 gas vesicle protein [Desertifilum sp. FACHB-1129]MBD2323015.1 gas vesicle protein [Desertifilum sp. FACHB-866]MBD2333446.1 gas vesicle protein [Desertifilum sp. FACHB-868]MCD8485947.1 gas vesicle protein [Desertifilum sp.]MDA0209217.1 gas vesicle protein [Cyanobacteria bacterium FC1]